MRRVLTLSTAAAAVAAVAVLCVAFTAGVAAAPDAGAVPAASGTGPTAPGAAPSASADECGPGDGPDLVGCWNGTHYEESVDFAETDGLNESQLSALTDLTMARVEHVRQRPFKEDVPVETVTRSEYVNDTASGNGSAAFRRWNDQVWEALFVVGDDTNANSEIDSVFGGAVSGFYSPSQDRIVIVVPDGESPDIDPSTLAHELLHAMQDQYHDLTDPRYVGATQDGDLAVDGIVEGEAVHVEERYAARCADNWTCAEPPESDGGGGGGADFNFGILQTVLQPYGDGALYVRELRDDGGWAAVNETMNDPPASTAEVIHRNPGYEEGNVTFEDAATGGWETYPDQGVDGAETAGEASMFVMFWYQSLEYRHAVLAPDATVQQNVQIHLDTEAQLESRAVYNYAHPVTDGWADDELYPYRNGDRDGYVWATEWQTADDAEAFRDAYVRMLTAHGEAEYADGTVYEIGPESDFPGAYGVERDGTSVTITHAPSPEGVLELRPDADLTLPDADGTDGADGSDGDGSDGTDGDDGNSSDGGDGSGDADGSDGADGGGGDTSDSTPGFGVAAALVALAGALGLAARRST
ncbi:PGF-CTERM sorting domain-containing protein [Halorubrum salinarum]|uniref:PGF-CTERM sorting domain-containing protein n=1 Tax=Halorubrum salinarum TaxID=2739057 RepID=A0A7D3Y0H3_9EURY|nr:Hvo_1808 family surface protein [Halorubrum salinarum]QKG92807.1 PGF-CTERM sorting domain-containing protein [Halorubrum salinarum]